MTETVVGVGEEGARLAGSGGWGWTWWAGGEVDKAAVGGSLVGREMQRAGSGVTKKNGAVVDGL